MQIRKLLVPVTGNDAGLPSLAAAFTVARRLGAHVEGLHARRNARDALAYIGEGMTGAMIEELITTAEEEGRALVERARHHFAEACEQAGFAQTPAVTPEGASTACLVVETGREEDLIAQRGRVSDMIVIARAEPDADVSGRGTLEAAMLESGRPLFLVPPDGVVGELSSVAIAWNGSFEASLAVSHALPILTEAQRVTVISIEEGSRPGPSTDDLVSYLAWHGIDAGKHSLEPHNQSTGEALLADAHQIGVGLLVMGAYTHSRLRRMILGSATGHMLDAADIPVMLMH